jgi:phosphonate dehydrogenase
MTGSKPRILITNRIYDDVRDRLAARGEVDVNADSEPWPQAEVIRRASSADAILAFMTDCIDAEVLAAAPRLRVVACALKGFDNFDIEACTEAGVWVSIVPDLLTAPTAELAVGLAIGLGRMIRDGDALVRSGNFDGWRPVLYGTGLDGSTVAIVGMGAVGRAIVERFKGFGCRLLGVDPCAAMPEGVTPVILDEAVMQSDFIIVAAPLTADNHHTIGADLLARAKPGALVVNIGRGSVTDEAAVADALTAGTLGGYAADVFEMEDWALADRPRAVDPRLLDHPRTLFTPHLGSAVKRVRHAIEMRAAEHIIDVLEGKAPRDAINAPRKAPRKRAAE